MFDSNKKIVYQDTLDEYHKRISALIGTGGSQISTMPTASEDYENVIYQYIGATDSTYTNGYFYKCIEDPENEGEYIWVNEQVQDGGSSGGGHEIEDSSGTAPTDYSTEEKIVGTWIDGKPLWQKTITTDNIAISANSWTNIASVSSVERIIGGTVNTGVGGVNIYLRVNNSNLQGYSSYLIEAISSITIQYTKTTDA